MHFFQDVLPARELLPVSYTHLDVYKRQPGAFGLVESSVAKGLLDAQGLTSGGEGLAYQMVATLVDGKLVSTCLLYTSRAVGEAERGATIGHRLSVGYDEVAALKVFPGTLVGFYPVSYTHLPTCR